MHTLRFWAWWCNGGAAQELNVGILGAFQDRFILYPGEEGTKVRAAGKLSKLFGIMLTKLRLAREFSKIKADQLEADALVGGVCS